MSFLIVLALALQPAITLAQTSSQPASKPAPPYVMTVPPGMKLVAVNQFKVVCVPDLETDVKKQVASVEPPTRPSTLPSDVVARIRAQRAALGDEMSRELGVEPAKVNDFLDEKLIKPLDQLVNVKPNLFFMLVTNDQIANAMKAGWTNPRFRLHLQDGHVLYDPHISITPDRQMDDIALLIEYKPEDKTEDAAKTLARSIADFETSYSAADANEAVFSARNLLITFIEDNVIKPLDLKPDQEWFGLGIVSVTTAKYTSEVTGVYRPEVVASLAQDSTANPVPSAGQDLVNQLTAAQVKPEFLPYVRDAIRRKATRVIDGLIQRDGDAITTRMLDAVRTQKPANNADLIHLVQTVTGVDILPQLAPK